eukprot:Hpha_TRINITY_DN16906_c1_g8::TRINITY_DN16906_c1_g8_i2::g.55256::m.55256
MFFNSFVLTKRGPLARIWLAAHWDKRLTKQEIQLIDLTEVVVQVMKPDIAISCRTHGELLLGCVKVFHNKVHLLLKDAQETKLHLKPPAPAAVKKDAEAEVEVKHVEAEDLAHLQEIEPLPLDAVGGGAGELDFKGIDAILKPPSKAPAGVEIDDDWFQAGVSQADVGLQQAQASVHLTQEALRDIAAQPKAGEEGRLSEKQDPRRQGEALEPEPWRPFTDLEEAELARLVGAPAGSEERPSDPPLPPPEDEFLPEMQVEPPKKRPRKLAKTTDAVTYLNNHVLVHNQRTESDTYRSPDQIPRFPLLPNGPQLRREQVMAVSEMIKEAMTSLRTASLNGEGLPLVLVGEAEIGESDEQMGLFKESVQALLKAAAETEEPDMVPAGHMMDEDFPPPQMDAPEDAFAFPPEPALSPGGGASRREFYGGSVDPVESAQRTLDELRSMMGKGKGKSVSFFTLTKAENRLAAARKLMDLLVLGSKGHVRLAQSAPYADITVTKDAAFDTAVEEDSFTQDPTQTQQSFA